MSYTQWEFDQMDREFMRRDDLRREALSKRHAKPIPIFSYAARQDPCNDKYEPQLNNLAWHIFVRRHYVRIT